MALYSEIRLTFVSECDCINREQDKIAQGTSHPRRIINEKPLRRV